MNRKKLKCQTNPSCCLCSCLHALTNECYEDYFVLETLYILNVAEKAGVDIDLQEAEKGIRGTSGKIRTTLCSFSH